MELNAYIYLGVRNRQEFGRMTLDEYYLRMEAAQIKRVREMEKLHLQAFLNQSVQATKGSAKNPKPKYPKFSDFYNSEKLIQDIRKEFEGDSYKPIKTKEEEKRETIARRISEYNKLLAERRKSNGGKL